MSRAYVLRTVRADMTSYNGQFRWPETGPVECSDWDPAPRCGGGLHGLLWGEGDGSLLDWPPTSRWLVVEVDPAECVDLDRKVKFPRGTVVYCGDRKGATDRIVELGATGAVVGATATAGDGGTATAGFWGTATAGAFGTASAGKEGTATAGDEGTATAGDWGTATAGDRGTATAGYGGTASAGDWGTATAGYKGAATAGDRGTATAGAWGTATAGSYGTVSAGDWGTATAGDGGTATAGYGGTATAGAFGTASAGKEGTASAGKGGTVSIEWWDGTRYRIAVGYVGEDGIEPDTPYRADDTGKIIVKADNRGDR